MIARRLRTLRRGARLVAADVVARWATEGGGVLSASTLYGWENGSVRLRPCNLSRLLDIYDAPPDIRLECFEALAKSPASRR
jgi:transcriptional regulator with XRE-family HTH domain